MDRKCRGLFIVFVSLSAAVSLAGTVEPGTMKWMARVSAVGGSPAIGPDGTIYIGTDSDMWTRKETGSGLYAVNPDGSVKWRYETAVPPYDVEVISSPSIAADGTIYAWAVQQDWTTETSTGALHAITPDGQHKWHRVTLCQSGHISAPPAIAADGTVYLGTDAGVFYAFTPDGDVKWQAAIGKDASDAVSAVAVGLDGTIYAGPFSGVLCALEPNGALKWQFPLQQNGLIGLALGADGTIYVTSQFSCLYALNPDGTLLWRSSNLTGVCGGPVIGGDGTIYLMSDDGMGRQGLAAINPDGTCKWQCSLGSWGGYWLYNYSPAVAADGTVYVAGGLFSYAVSADGTHKWQVPLLDTWTTPAIAQDGTVYFGGPSLFAVAGSAPLANTPWPKMGHDAANSGRATPYGDIDGDGSVDAADLLALVASWGLSIDEAGYNARCDLTADGIVDVSDLLTLMENWNE